MFNVFLKVPSCFVHFLNSRRISTEKKIESKIKPSIMNQEQERVLVCLFTSFILLAFGLSYHGVLVKLKNFYQQNENRLNYNFLMLLLCLLLSEKRSQSRTSIYLWRLNLRLEHVLHQIARLQHVHLVDDTAETPLHFVKQAKHKTDYK